MDKLRITDEALATLCEGLGVTTEIVYDRSNDSGVLRLITTDNSGIICNIGYEDPNTDADTNEEEYRENPHLLRECEPHLLRECEPHLWIQILQVDLTDQQKERLIKAGMDFFMSLKDKRIQQCWIPYGTPM